MRPPSVIVMPGRGNFLYGAETKNRNEEHLAWRLLNRQAKLIVSTIIRVKEEAK